LKSTSDRLPELLTLEPPAALDALVLERALLVFQRGARPSVAVKGPARDRAADPTPALLSRVPT
jgi:hypothetical protein